MSIQIEVIDSEVQPMVEFYGTRLRAIREQRKALEADEKRYEELISKLLKKMDKDQSSVSQKDDDSNYNANWAIHEKITFVLTLSKKPLTTREIIDQLLILDPALNADRQRTDKNISTVLSIQNGKKYDRKEDGKEYKYYLKK